MKITKSELKNMIREALREELYSNRSTLTEARYPYTCIHCGGTAHFPAHGVPEDEEAIHTPVGLLHKKCWDDWNDQDEMNAYNYYYFAKGDFTLSKAERISAQQGWENCRKSGKIYMDDYECDKVERAFNDKNVLASIRNKKDIFFGAFTDCHNLELIHFITEDEDEARFEYRECVADFIKQWLDSDCRCELFKVTVSQKEFNALMKLRDPEGEIDLDDVRKISESSWDFVQKIYDRAESLDSESGDKI